MKNFSASPRLLASVLACLLSLCVSATAQTIAPNFLGGGTTSFDGWVNMNVLGFSGYGGFPGSAAWPTSAGSNATGSKDAELVRVAGAPGGGGPFFATESLYFYSPSQVANALGGTLRVSDPTPVTGVKTIALQVEIGEAVGYGFQSPEGHPVLKVNGQPATYAPAHKMLLNRYQNGTFESPATGEEPIYVKTLGYQWNVASLGPISSIQIEFSAVTHAQIYEIRLDQTDVAQSRAVFIPEFLALGSPGTPQFSGVTTTVTHSFTGPPSRILVVEYSDLVGQSPWTASAPVETGSGSFDVTFTAEGDRREAWSRNMFFRAKYPD